eukprot:TRINITY_DN367_c1_g1_i11.p1 TRINITY_DN367_c1_g1~~TRINITY_DN367_c1_g1_i11.p1  ORF type:complete len:129 (+),score=37.98 TRINITY_DN367_c1_g1_i11:54-389(+)
MKIAAEHFCNYLSSHKCPGTCGASHLNTCKGRVPPKVIAALKDFVNAKIHTAKPGEIAMWMRDISFLINVGGLRANDLRSLSVVLACHLQHLPMEAMSPSMRQALDYVLQL